MSLWREYSKSEKFSSDKDPISRERKGDLDEKCWIDLDV
jgi:hypothetical protein